MDNTDSGRSRTDDLALVRTDLANERTLLAYLRTSLMVFGTGVTLIKFFADTDSLRQTGWGLAAAGCVVGVIGIIRFFSMRRRLRS